MNSLPWIRLAGLVSLPMFAFLPLAWMGSLHAAAYVKFGPVMVYSLLRFLVLSSNTAGLKLYPAIIMSLLNWLILMEMAACFSSLHAFGRSIYQCHSTPKELDNLIGVAWLADAVLITYEIVTGALALLPKPTTKRD